MMADWDGIQNFINVQIQLYAFKKHYVSPIALSVLSVEPYCSYLWGFHDVLSSTILRDRTSVYMNFHLIRWEYMIF